MQAAAATEVEVAEGAPQLGVLLRPIESIQYKLNAALRYSAGGPMR
jgi:hypothetical protein